MCTTTTYYATHISTECSVGGSGQCDGYCQDHSHQECTCSCHTAYDLPHTVSAVRDWHDEQDSVVDSFDYDEGNDVSLNEAQQAAIARAKTLAYGSNKEFRAVNGQGRVVVQEYYR